MENENLKPIEKLTPFTKMIMTIGTLPSSFYASMSYYESMVWLYEYLKNQVIPTVNNNAEAVEELQTAFTTLETFISKYFDNLDVQEEINQKLDEMAEDGTMTNLIKNYIDPLYQAYEEEINNDISNQNNEITNFKNTVNSQIQNIDEKVTNATGGSPKGVYATVSALQTADPDHDYIYVVSANGNWYYYDTTNTEWTSGGTYQSTGIGDYTIFTQNFESNIQSRVNDKIDFHELTYTETAFKYMINNGNKWGGALFNNLELTVKENDIVDLDIYLDLTLNHPIYVLLNDTTVVSYSGNMSSENNAHYTNSIKIPSGVNKISVNYVNRYNRSIALKNVVNSKELKDNIEYTLNTIAPYTSITPTTTANAYISFNNTTHAISVNNNSSYLYKKYDVSNISKCHLVLEPSTSATIYGILFSDVDDIVIDLDEYLPNTTETVIEKDIYVPSEAKYLYIQTAYNKKLDLQNREFLNSEDIINDNIIYDRYNIKQLQRRCTNLEKQNEFQWGPFDKTYFVFVEDDCNNYFPKAVEIFANNNVPLSSAAIIENLERVWTDYTPSNTKTVKELLDEIVENGGEVLSHYSGNLAPPGTPDSGGTHYITSEEGWLSKTRDVKMTLENNGFNVRGIILADSSIPNTQTGQDYCSLYFDYSDRFGLSKNFNLGRRKFFSDGSMQTLQQVKDYIDTCCQTPGFYPFCFHKYSETEPMASEENLNAILSYINAKGSNVCECTTYSYVFDNFGSTELAERIRALE